jgi:hypothetical protein
LIHSKKDLPKLKKFEIKYSFEGFARGTTFSIRVYSDLKWILNYKFGKSMFVFAFRKLIKIARNRLSDISNRLFVAVSTYIT